MTLPALAALMVLGLASPAQARHPRRPGGSADPGRDGPPLTLALALGGALPLDGDAGLPADAPPPGGDPRPRPGLSDAFDPGYAVSLVAAFRFTAAVNLTAEAGALVLPGRRREEGYLGTVRYSAMNLFTGQVGLRFSAPFHLEADEWFRSGCAPRNRGFEPYLGLSAGLCHRCRVSLRPVGGYWRESTVFCASFRLGVEFAARTLSLFLEAGVVYVSEPVETVWFAEADPALLAELRGGVRVYFG